MKKFTQIGFSFHQLIIFSYLLVLIVVVSISRVQASSFVAFESGQVRPLALSPNGTQLFAVNTPNNRVEIFDIKSDGLSHVSSLAVGMEPVALAVNDSNEVWVVNHLSDSISIVDVSMSPPRVVRTLLVGDEPRDIVFAGVNKNRAFVTTAHRGQNGPYTSATNPGELITPGTGRADVWVFDVANPGSSLGGDPLTIVTLFGDTPRALAVSPDGSTVYAAVFNSGNKTTSIAEGAVCNGGVTAVPCSPLAGESTAPGGLPLPNQSSDGLPAPEVGIIVKHDGSNWKDELGRNWDNMVRFDLPDMDVFAINAVANPPVQTISYPHIGTTLFNMVVHPANGKLYISNTEAINEVRFEGVRVAGDTTSSVQGHLHEARVTIVNPVNADVITRHLNKHIDYSVSPAAAVKSNSLSSPRGMVISADGSALYLAAKGSNKIGIFDTVKLQDDSFIPSSSDHIVVTGGGPSGLVLDESRQQLYALTRFDNGISVLDISSKSETKHYQLANPEPEHIVIGRPFLYDAQLTSSNGEAACASCHIDGDMDHLAWDLGDPEINLINNPSPFLGAFGPVNNPPAFYLDYHPMKGPMTTQTLRGMATHGPMHWRGDRTGGNDEINMQPDSGTFDEVAAFKKFNVSFEGLLGRQGPLTDEDMQKFTDFILDVKLPPNPIRALDDSLTVSQRAGMDFYFSAESDGVNTTCNSCHVLDPVSGFFGTDGSSSFEAESQHFKIPHLRNMYTKVGMFGMPKVPLFSLGDNSFTGNQIRGFGFIHDGSVDTIKRFFGSMGFTFPGATGIEQDQVRRQLEQFMLAFDTDLKPIVGQQITLNSTNKTEVDARIDLLIARAIAGDCDLIAKGYVGGENRGWLHLSNGSFQSDKASDPVLTDAQLRLLAETVGQQITYTCAPQEVNQLVARRMGIDQDEDAVLDGDDICPSVANTGQVDTDGDGLGDLCDNCTEVANVNQRDSNGDGFGNQCDLDLNNDGFTNFADLAIFSTTFGASSPDSDVNGDGVVNFPDLATFRAVFGKPPGPSNPAVQ